MLNNKLHQCTSTLQTAVFLDRIQRNKNDRELSLRQKFIKTKPIEIQHASSKMNTAKVGLPEKFTFLETL